MDLFLGTLPYVQIVLAILLVVAVLLQERGASVGGGLGADASTTSFTKRRGFEKVLFQATMGIAGLFVLTTLIAIVF